MSKLYDLRDGMKDLIVAAEIGWTDGTVIVKRQGSFWNQVATAINASKNGAVLHIGVADGKPTEDAGLEMEISLPLLIIAKPQVGKDAVPEEDLWENLVLFMEELRVGTETHWSYRFRFDGFQDIDIVADGGTAYLGRQTIYKRKFSLG